MDTITEAAQVLAQRIADERGIDLPAAGVDGSAPVIMELPRKIVEEGGVAISVLVVSPPGPPNPNLEMAGSEPGTYEDEDEPVLYGGSE